MTPHIVAPNVHRFEKVTKEGWGLNMFVAQLPDRGLLIHSPTWLGPGTFEAVDALGEVRVIVAPNHFHHLSLPRFRERYPKALAVAAEGALPRLAKKGHSGVEPLSAAAALLPPGARFIVPDGMKTGESWLSMPGDGGPTWLVCDAWFNVKPPVTGLVGFFVRLTKTGPGFTVGRMLRPLHLRDRAAYLAFTRAELAREKPAIVLPSHGEPILAEGSTPAHARALAALEERLG
jgi:hypothetical protein